MKHVLELHKFLIAIREEPSKYARDDELIKALGRQERLGQYNSDKYKIVATSRSTIDRVCKLAGHEGLDFDGKRRDALQALKDVRTILDKSEKPRRRNTQAFREQARASERSEVMRMVDCMHLTRALCKAVKVGRYIAAMSDREAAKVLWEREERVILAMMSLSKSLVVRKASDEETWVNELIELHLK